MTDLADLIPSHVIARDEESGGLLRALLESIGGELDLLEADLDRLYASWFIETCPEWVVPYIGDLVGVVGLPTEQEIGRDSGVSRRAVVANTVAYRRRKGTVAVIEQVVRDVTGWPTRAVEFYRLLGTTTHVNHPRLDRPTFASLRHAAAVEVESSRLAAGSLTSFAHTGEVRRIQTPPIPSSSTRTARGPRGRYSIGNIGVFVFPVQVYEAVAAPARVTSDPGSSWWATHPLGWDQPLFAIPRTEESIEHLALESDLSLPLRPRRLLAALESARAGGAPGSVEDSLPMAVRVDAADALSPDRLRVCGLEDLATDPAIPANPLPGWQVMVDPVRGRLRPYLNGVRTEPTTLHVDHSYGACADVGAGTHDRSLAHADALLMDPYIGDLDAVQASGGEVGDDPIGAQTHVRLDSVAPGEEASLTDGLAQIEARWADPLLNLVGTSQVLSIGDSEAYLEDLTVDIPTESRLILVAAGWSGRVLLNGDIEAPTPGIYTPVGLRPRITGDLTVTGAIGSGALLDGLVIEGDVIIEPGSLRSLTISQCTIAGTIRVNGTVADGNRELTLTCWRSQVGGLDVVDTVPEIKVADSVVDPTLAHSAGPAISSPETHLVAFGSTIFGAVDCRTISVSSSICDGLVTVVDRQTGCARFSYFGPGSRVPRRFRCVPVSDGAAGDAPSYADIVPGSPFYPSLAVNAPTSIRRGGEYGAEMGVHHHLRRPPRIDAATRLVAPYVPAGMNLALFGS